MFRRIRNLWRLSGYRLEHQDAIESLMFGHIGPKLVQDVKPKKKLAIIVEDKPLDIFPDETSK